VLVQIRDTIYNYVLNYDLVDKVKGLGVGMFDLNKLGDMAKMARDAKQIHTDQQRIQGEQVELLRKISSQLDSVLSLLKK